MAIVLPGINQFFWMWWLELLLREISNIWEWLPADLIQTWSGMNWVFHPEIKEIFNRGHWVSQIYNAKIRNILEVSEEVFLEFSKPNPYLFWSCLNSKFMSKISIEGCQDYQQKPWKRWNAFLWLKISFYSFLQNILELLF